MTLQWIPLEHLEAHPENSNRMPPPLLDKLKRHIERTGLYEPLVVRPLSAPAAPACQPACQSVAGRSVAGRAGDGAARRYQILNGHHRARALGELGHTHARCDVWEVDDAEARLLLATLNRLEGRDDPSARAALVAHLAEGRTAEDLARLLPEPPDAVERLMRLARPPEAPLPPDQVRPPARPMTFFLADEQYALVTEALREVGHDGASAARMAGPGAQPPYRDTGPEPDGPREGPAPKDGRRGDRPTRAEALERLAQWYLESRSLR